jgi:hypothetical protein
LSPRACRFLARDAKGKLPRAQQVVGNQPCPRVP